MPDPTSPKRQDSASLTVAADSEAIWRVFVDPDALVKWLPPGGMTGRVLEYDFREGGRYRIELSYGDLAPAGTGKTTDNTDVSTGLFLSLDAGRRIVYSVEFDSTDPSFAGEMRLTWMFDPVPGGTRVTIVADDVPVGIGKKDHDDGLRGSLENLERFLREAER